jgi:hypothetical protein
MYILKSSDSASIFFEYAKPNSGSRDIRSRNKFWHRRPMPLSEATVRKFWRHFVRMWPCSGSLAKGIFQTLALLDQRCKELDQGEVEAVIEAIKRLRPRRTERDVVAPLGRLLKISRLCLRTIPINLSLMIPPPKMSDFPCWPLADLIPQTDH